MRSRYSAFALGREQYLLDTWSVATRPPLIECEPQTKWLGLEIKSKRMVDLNHGYVEFVARYRLKGQATRLHENSFFMRQENRWLYVNAQD
jgi:SEC-C motif-containing protein